MLSQAENPATRQVHLHTCIDAWLNERQQVLVEYCQLAGLTADRTQGQHALPSTEQRASFCELLMDYVSAGHFEVFDIMAYEDPDGEQLREQLYPVLLETTDIALSFNDQYADVDAIDAPVAFESAVALLGEALVRRIESEDQLIQHLATHMTPMH